ncbi:MAG: proline--tRNA ligase [Bacillota bacterium]
MRASQLLIPTLREVPADAEVVSHQLLVRAGFIRKAAAGVYNLLPLAFRVVKKIETIVREEMDRQGGQELVMPIIQPAELWQESGRWDVYGPELFRLKDRHGRDFCLGPTHEEIITDLVRNEVKSYRQLPLLLYQIQNKYRDERRPRFGLLRGREFIMKDLYSFDRDHEGLEISYQKMFTAYTRVFERCGLRFRPVEADSGAIGGRDTHEFIVFAAAGESTVVFCPHCDYAANVERASSPPGQVVTNEEPAPLREVATPGRRTVAEVTSFLGMDAKRLIKTLLFETEQGFVAALVRGDRDINEVKLQKELAVLRCELADLPAVARISGAAPGYAGPVGLPGVKIAADLEVMQMVNAVTGANKDDTHFLNVNPGRDFKPDLVADLRLVRAGDPCPVCARPLSGTQGIEVGQIFKLGDKYSKALGATFLDENGQPRPMIMGCYGIGITRTMAAAVEQNHDENGIVWPLAIAPFHVVVVPVSDRDEKQMTMANQVYELLAGAGVEVVLDDRPERPGVKFKDADLIGYPLRITVGNKAVQSGEVEVRRRATGETTFVPVDNIVAYVKKIIGEV